MYKMVTGGKLQIGPKNKEFQKQGPLFKTRASAYFTVNTLALVYF
jgi:hypothetical protein